MKKNKILLVLSVVTILVMGLTTAAFAAVDYQTPAEIVSGLTGKSEDEVITERQAGNTYGAQAQAAGKLAEFKDERLKLYEQNLDEAVLDESLTQEQADELLTEMNVRMEDCDGTGTGIGTGEGNGMGNGLRDGSGEGQGSGLGGRMGMGRGAGNGTGLGDGSCIEADDNV